MTKIRQKHLKTSQYSLRQEVKAFFAYFENTWIGQKLSRGRRQPMFAYSLWNKHSDMVADNFHLTNNSLEAMNSSWAPNVPRSATIWTIVHRFQKEEMLARVTHNETIRGVTESHNNGRSERQRQKMLELQQLCCNFGKCPTEQYLESVMNIFM